MAESHKLGDLQHAILRVLWEKKEATVVEVLEALSDERDRALTTIATMLTKMEKRKLVSHRSEGRQFVYRPLVSESQVRRSMVAELASKLFEAHREGKLRIHICPRRGLRNRCFLRRLRGRRPHVPR